MIKPVTAITTCKNRLEHLKQTLPLMSEISNIDIVVVDYGCPAGAGGWVRENYPHVRVVDINDDPGFSLSRARNGGAAVADTPWLMFIDADVKVGKGLEQWIDSGLKPKHFYVTDQYGSDLSGTIFCERDAFHEAGGYDEAFRRWGGEDDDLRYRLIKNGCAKANYPGEYFDFLPHSDEERLRYSNGVKSRNQACVANQLYSTIKYDLEGQQGRKLALEERQHLYDLAFKSSQNSFLTGIFRPSVLELELGERTDLPRFANLSVSRKCIYKLSLLNPPDKS